MEKLIINGGAQLKGEIVISGSKNAALPIIVASLLLDGPSTMTNIPNLEDVRLMIQVLEHLGAEIEFEDNVLYIDPTKFNNNEVPYELIRKMRGSIYVLGPLLAKFGKARVSLPGGCAIGSRPVDLHLKGMEALGATISIKNGFIDATVEGRLKGDECELIGENGPSVGATCNVIMAAVLAEGETIIHGAAIEPEIGDLIEFLQKAGAIIRGKNTKILTINGRTSLNGISFEVLPDRIETGTFMAAAAITRGNFLLRNCRPENLKSEIDKLREMGVSVEVGEQFIRVKHSGRIESVSIRTSPYPGFATDLQAQFTALLAISSGESTVTESVFPDRFIHTAELNRMGANIGVTHATAVIKGIAELSGAHIMATDLRASAALVLAALAANGTTDIHRIYHLDRGYENLEFKLNACGADIQRVNDI